MDTVTLIWIIGAIIFFILLVIKFLQSLEEKRKLKEEEENNISEFNSKKRTKAGNYEGIYDIDGEKQKSRTVKIYLKHNGRCAYCGRKALGMDVYQCKYCDLYHCTAHRLPESHNCTGNPRKPPGGIREVHSGGQIHVYGK